MYQDLGPNHFQRRNKDQQRHLLVKRLADLGYAAALTPLPGTAVARPHRSSTDLVSSPSHQPSSHEQPSRARRSAFSLCAN